MGSPATLSVVRYYSISALVVGFWLLAAVLWVPGDYKVVVEDDEMASILGRPDAVHLGRTIKGLELAEAGEELVSEEELGVFQASLPRLYHSPEVFALSYDEMRSRMKVWVYPEQEGSDRKYDHGRGEDESLSSTADLFYRLLIRSDFVTESASDAHLFLMPVSLDALWVGVGPANVADHLRRYVQKIRTDYAFWDSSLGADHLFLSCHGFDHNSKHRNMLELGKNAIQAACSPLRHNQRFVPHKDMVFPEYKPVTEQELLAGRSARRTTLAYFPEAGSSPGQPSSLYSKIASSKFCVSLPPHEFLSVVDALRFGCVPVLVSKTVFHDLPFQGFLNWREFAIVLDVEQLPNLKPILESVSAAKYRQMQYLGHQASKHLEWNNPPVAYDAFHMTLLELWSRRHSIKYARRTVNS